MKTPQFLISYPPSSPARKTRAKRKVVSSFKCSPFSCSGAFHLLFTRLPILLGLLLFSAFPFPPSAFSAPVPYAGKLAVNGLNFDGIALHFALRDANGTVHWRNGRRKRLNQRPVDRGHYAVLLGAKA